MGTPLLSTATQAVVDQIVASPVVEGWTDVAPDGFALVSPHAAALRDVATDEEWPTLLGHPHGAVKLYALSACGVRRPDDFARFAERAVMSSQPWDVELRDEAGATHRPTLSHAALVRVLSVATPAQRDAVVTALVASNVRMPVLESLPGSPGPGHEAFHTVLAGLVARGCAAAFPVLTRFRREEDVPLVERAFGDVARRYHVLHAVLANPHPRFLPALRALHGEVLAGGRLGTHNHLLYSALMLYPPSEVRPLFEATLASAAGRGWEGRSSLEAMFPALSGDPHGVERLNAGMGTPRVSPEVTARLRAQGGAYDDLLARLWTAHDLTSPAVIAHLLARDPAILDAFQGGPRPVPVTAPETLDWLLRTLLDQGARAQVVAILARGLAAMDVRYYRVLARFAAECRDRSLVETLARAVAVHDNAHVYLNAIKALLGYADPAIDARVEALFARRLPALRAQGATGHWSLPSAAMMLREPNSWRAWRQTGAF